MPQPTRALVLVLALSACGPASPDRLRSYLRSDSPPDVVDATRLEVARAADFQRAEEELQPSGVIPGDDLRAALELLDEEREATGDPPLLFVRARPVDGGFAVTPLDTRAWFDSRGRWVPNPGDLRAAPDSEDGARQLESIGGHLRTTYPPGIQPAVSVRTQLPNFVVVSPTGLWVNPQLAPLLPIALPPVHPRTETGAPQTGGPSNATAAAEVGVSNLTGSGRFDDDTSVESCEAREGNRCRDCLTGGGCDPVFPGDDGASECQDWSANSAQGIAELCCAGLLARSGASACVQGTVAAACPFTDTALSSSGTLSQDATFAGSPACVSALDQCLPSSGAGTTAVNPVVAAPSCGACNDGLSGCAEVTNDCTELPSEACGSIDDGCNGYSGEPSSSEPDTDVTVTSGGSGGPTASATATGTGTGTAAATVTGDTSSGGVSSGDGATGGGETSGGTATGGDVGSGTGSGGDLASGASSGGGSDDSSGCDSCSGSDDSSGCDSCGSGDCSGGDCSGGGDCGGCSTAETPRPHKPWRPIHEATFAALAPLAALLVRRKR